MIVHKPTGWGRSVACRLPRHRDGDQAGRGRTRLGHRVDRRDPDGAVHGRTLSSPPTPSSTRPTSPPKPRRDFTRRPSSAGRPAPPRLATSTYASGMRRAASSCAPCGVDPERAPHIRWAFAAYASGAYTLDTLHAALEAPRTQDPPHPEAARAGALTGSDIADASNIPLLRRHGSLRRGGITPASTSR